MEIHLGKAFDGNRTLHQSDRLGQQTIGPIGLLNALETHLGLLSTQVTQSERIVQYRDVLNKRKESSFYQKSFELDELGTAQTLLHWRDTWYLHGWQGFFNADASQQLKEVAAAEFIASITVAYCEGQRSLKRL